ncbi:pyroglutamyl-peptidase I [Ramlibacter sp.]|uniref:pyroglutamyl-peptidase I n=1 Tax=Ramlibacter sp. TaxID=1917967 RepID=UPI003FA785EB
MLGTAPGADVGLRRILVTGFDPFGGAPVNPSWAAVQALDGLQMEGHRVVAARLPTQFDSCLRVLDELITAHRPALVLCTGQAGGRAAVSLERVAINIDDARIPDNAGAQPIDTPVRAGGPAAYFSTLPIKAMLAALLAGGFRAEVSQTAGTFVCNHVFYGLMHRLATDPACAGMRGGFVHVPWLPEQGHPSMTLEQLVSGLELALRCALRTGSDIRLQAGSLG